MRKTKTVKLGNLFLIAIIFSLTFSLFNGCEENNPLNPTITSRMQLTHASVDAPNFDVYLGNTLVSANLPYLSTLSYISVTGDAVGRIKVNAANTSTVLIDTSFYFIRDKSFSVFVFDSLRKIKPMILTDDLTPPGSTNASVRFINLSPNSPAIDVGGVGKVQSWFPFYSFPQASSFRPIVGNTYAVYANLAGTTTNLITVPNVLMQGGGIYTIIATGNVGGTGTQAFRLTLIPNN